MEKRVKLGTLLQHVAMGASAVTAAAINSAGSVALLGGGVLAASSLAVAVPAAAQNYSQGYKFLQAVDKREMKDAIELLEKPGSTVVNARDITSGRTALHIVVARRDLGWINFLKERGANPNIKDGSGTSPLMLASQLGFTEGLQALIGMGARVDDANDAGETPLILAVHRRDVPMIRMLLAAGGNADRADASGRSARDYAQDSTGSVKAALAQDAQAAQPAPSAQTYGPSF